MEGSSINSSVKSAEAFRWTYMYMYAAWFTFFTLLVIFARNFALIKVHVHAFRLGVPAGHAKLRFERIRDELLKLVARCSNMPKLRRNEEGGGRLVGIATSGGWLLEGALDPERTKLFLQNEGSEARKLAKCFLKTTEFVENVLRQEKVKAGLVRHAHDHTINTCWYRSELLTVLCRFLTNSHLFCKHFFEDYNQ